MDIPLSSFLKEYSCSSQKGVEKEVSLEVQKTVEISVAPEIEQSAEIEKTLVQEHSKQRTVVLNLAEEGSNQKGVDKPTPQKEECSEETVANVLTDTKRNLGVEDEDLDVQQEEVQKRLERIAEKEKVEVQMTTEKVAPIAEEQQDQGAFILFVSPAQVGDFAFNSEWYFKEEN